MDGHLCGKYRDCDKYHVHTTPRGFADIQQILLSLAQPLVQPRLVPRFGQQQVMILPRGVRVGPYTHIVGEVTGSRNLSVDSLTFLFIIHIYIPSLTYIHTYPDMT